MMRNRVPGEDGILVEMIYEGGTDNWNNAIGVLLVDKGDQTDFHNYRPIRVLSQMNKLFTKIITNRLTKKLDYYWPIGFRGGYSTCAHLLAMRLL